MTIFPRVTRVRIERGNRGGVRKIDGRKSREEEIEGEIEGEEGGIESRGGVYPLAARSGLEKMIIAHEEILYP